MKKQKGAALIVSLVLLTLVALLGVAGVQTIGLEEKMAGHSFDRNLAFQAAEAALREAEQYVETNKPTASYTDADDTCPSSAINNCANGLYDLCPPPDKDCPSRWLPASGFTQWKNATNVSVSALAGTPRYFIEYLGNTFPCIDGGPSDPKNCKRYRITARGNPGAGRASVMLQSVYRTE